MTPSAARAAVEAWMDEECFEHWQVRVTLRHGCPDCLLAFVAAQRAAEAERWHAKLSEQIEATRKEAAALRAAVAQCPGAHAVLDAAVQYYDQAQRGDTATALSIGAIADAHDALYDAIRRYRATLPA